jgi:hypothetical protein
VKIYDGEAPNLTFEADAFSIDGLIDGDTDDMALTGALARAGG